MDSAPYEEVRSGSSREEHTVRGGAYPLTDEEQRSPRERLRLGWASRKAAAGYGFLAVVVVAIVQVSFSLRDGGFFPEQWYWGAAAIGATLAGAVLVPGYFSSVGRKQWAMAGTLVVLTAVVTASISWSISPVLSFNEASRTAMYAGAFVVLLPAATRWGSLVLDATVFGALLPPAIYGILQKILPTSVEYTGFSTLEWDPKVSSTVGYHPTFGLMCAMGALLVIARVGSFRSLRSTPLRALYSSVGVLFLVALYFSFSRGALMAFAAGALVLLVLSKHRFEALGDLATSVVPALWIVSQARDYPGLVSRPVSLETMQTDGLALIDPLWKGLVLGLIAQTLFALLARAIEGYVPGGVRRGARLVGTALVTCAVAGVFFLGWTQLQETGGFDGLKSRITASDAELQAEALATDTTQRLSSLSAASRLALWEIAWGNWREHPLTGTGGDTYQVVYLEKAPASAEDVLHPHSMWMSLLSDTGIFAFLAFAAFCAWCLAFAVYNAFSTTSSRSRALLAGSAAAITAYLASSSVDWNWYIPASTLPFFVLAAVATGTTKRCGPKERSMSGSKLVGR